MPFDPSLLMAKVPVIPVLTIERHADAVPLARALVAGGLPVIEVTLRTRVALDAIWAIAAEVADCVVGAGTVLRPADVSAAVAAGAKYLVSPGTPAPLASCGGRKAEKTIGRPSAPARARLSWRHGPRQLRFTKWHWPAWKTVVARRPIWRSPM